MKKYIKKINEIQTASRATPLHPTPSPHLQGGAPRPAAVGVQVVLARRRAELRQLLLLQLIGGEALQHLEEGAAGHGRHVQVALHQVAQRARLRQPRRP